MKKETKIQEVHSKSEDVVVATNFLSQEKKIKNLDLHYFNNPH